MKKFGITGGIGAGKSTVANMLRELGYPVYDCDVNAKQMMTGSFEVRNAIIAKFGPDAYIGGQINKPFMAKQIFSNEENNRYVKSIVHPAVIKDFNAWAERSFSDIVFVESALLYESGLSDIVDGVVYVDADKEIRIERVMQRDNKSREAVEACIKAQENEYALMKASNCIVCEIQNIGDMEYLSKQVNNLVDDLEKLNSII